MTTNVTAAELVFEVPFAVFPNGEYRGVWGGYVVTVTIGGREFRLHTEVGIRTPAAPCLVRVCDGEVTVRAIEHEPIR